MSAGHWLALKTTSYYWCYFLLTQVTAFVALVAISLRLDDFGVAAFAYAFHLGVLYGLKFIFGGRLIQMARDNHKLHDSEADVTAAELKDIGWITGVAFSATFGIGTLVNWAAYTWVYQRHEVALIQLILSVLLTLFVWLKSYQMALELVDWKPESEASASQVQEPEAAQPETPTVETGEPKAPDPPVDSGSSLPKVLPPAPHVTRPRAMTAGQKFCLAVLILLTLGVLYVDFSRDVERHGWLEIPPVPHGWFTCLWAVVIGMGVIEAWIERK